MDPTTVIYTRTTDDDIDELVSDVYGCLKHARRYCGEGWIPSDPDDMSHRLCNQATQPDPDAHGVETESRHTNRRHPPGTQGRVMLYHDTPGETNALDAMVDTITDTADQVDVVVPSLDNIASAPSGVEKLNDIAHYQVLLSNSPIHDINSGLRLMPGYPINDTQAKIISQWDDVTPATDTEESTPDTDSEPGAEPEPMPAAGQPAGTPEPEPDPEPSPSTDPAPRIGQVMNHEAGRPPYGYIVEDGCLVPDVAGDDGPPIEQISNVLKSVKSDDMSIRAAAKELDCSRGTIHNCLDRPEQYGLESA